MVVPTVVNAAISGSVADLFSVMVLHRFSEALLLLLLFKITDAMRARVASEDPRYQLWEHASEAWKPTL